MLFTIALVLLALTMGGLLFTLGIIQSILAKVESLFKSAGSVITGAAITGIGVNTLIGEQYLSILLTGEAFKAQFAKVGLAPKTFHASWRMQVRSSILLCLGVFVVFLSQVSSVFPHWITYHSPSSVYLVRF